MYPIQKPLSDSASPSLARTYLQLNFFFSENKMNAKSEIGCKHILFCHSRYKLFWERSDRRGKFASDLYRKTFQKNRFFLTRVNKVPRTKTGNSSLHRKSLEKSHALAYPRGKVSKPSVQVLVAFIIYFKNLLMFYFKLSLSTFKNKSES